MIRKMKTMATSISDLSASMLDWMKGITANPVVSFPFLVDPVPASRPRVTRWKTFYLKTYQKFRDDADLWLQDCGLIPTDKPLFCMVEVVAKKPRTGKLKFPRGDVDNYVKGPWDKLNKLAWDDDNQIVGCAVFKRYAEPTEVPGFYLHWTEVSV